MAREDRFLHLIEHISSNRNTSGQVGKWIASNDHSHLFDADTANNPDLVNHGSKWYEYSLEQHKKGRILKYKKGKAKSARTWWVIPKFKKEFEDTYPNFSLVDGSPIN